MFHLLNYTVSAGVNAADTNMTASVDEAFSQRNGNYIFSEAYRILAHLGLGTSLLRIRYNVASWNNTGRVHIDPPNRSATIPSNPQAQWFTDYELWLPQLEEIQLQTTGDLAMGTEQNDAFVWVAPQGWSRNLPRGERIQVLRFTGAVAGTANVWGALGALTFADTLRTGIYSVVHAEVFDAGSKAFRFAFPKAPLIQGRRLRPGNVCREAIANVPLRSAESMLSPFGLWGRFHTFEPPQIEVFANATGASVQEGRMWVVYEGERGLL